jgi:transposase InsO family protein
LPRANAICERFLGSVRRECLDHLLILHEKQLQRVLNAFVLYFNRARPHQGILQHLLTATALNVVRLVAWLFEPSLRGTQISRFAALALAQKELAA